MRKKTMILLVLVFIIAAFMVPVFSRAREGVEFILQDEALSWSLSERGGPPDRFIAEIYPEILLSAIVHYGNSTFFFSEMTDLALKAGS